MSEFSLPDYAAVHHKLALPVVEGTSFPNSTGLIHFHSDQEISEMMVELSVLCPGSFRIALFTFTEDQQQLQLIPFETAKALRLNEDIEHLGMNAFWWEGTTYHVGILAQI